MDFLLVILHAFDGRTDCWLYDHQDRVAYKEPEQSEPKIGWDRRSGVGADVSMYFDSLENGPLNVCYMALRQAPCGY